MDEASDAVGQALCCAAAVRLGGAVQVPTERDGLLDHYIPIMAGVESISAFLNGHELDDGLLGAAFAGSWYLDARYQTGLPGYALVKDWTSLVFGTAVLTRPEQQSILAEQTLDFASKAAAAWPSAVRVSSFDSLARFELACQQEAEDRVWKDGLPALWKLTDVATKSRLGGLTREPADAPA